MITADDLITDAGQHQEHRALATAEIIANAGDLANRLNNLAILLGRSLVLTSGWRPGDRGEGHAKCRAADLRDRDLGASHHCKADQELLVLANLWLEDPDTNQVRNEPHMHVQSYPPKSGKRVFLP